MKALSWKEPFASLMLFGKIETRTWNTNYRGLVLICACKKSYSESDLIQISGEGQTQRILTTLNSKGIKEHPGKAIAVGRLVDCRPMTKDDEEKCFVKYREGLHCHIYTDVKAIKPIDWKGSQGWKNVTSEFIERINQ